MAEVVIQWVPNTSLGLGVSDQSSGAQVGLYTLFGSGATTVWNVNLTQNVIWLEAGGKQLALDFQGGKVGPEVQLVLSPYNGTPTPSQRWSIMARKGYITSLADTSLVVDDKNRNPTPGNPVWAYPFNGSPAQQWTPVNPWELLMGKTQAA